MSAQSSDPNEFVPAQLVQPQASGPIRVVIEQPRSSRVFRALRWGVGILLVLMVFGSFGNYYEGESADLREQWHSRSKTALDKVAIIAVEGTIMGDEGYVKSQIDQVRNDSHIKAVVLRVDSPGGTVTGSDYIYHHLKKLTAERKIPLVVSMGGIAASGGYYVAMAAGDGEKLIFAEPTTWTGSIGVIIPHYNFSGLLEKYHVQDDSIASNPLKMMGSPTRKFEDGVREQEQAILKGLVDSSFEGFKEIVLASRKALRESPDAQEVAFTGRIFTAKQAKEYLLVDELGFVEDAIDRAAELANLDKDKVRVVKYKKPTALFDQMLFGQQSRKPPIDLSALLDLTVPRAYYMCTWLPALSTSGAR